MGIHVHTSGSERSLATILFTDIVGSTERAVELGDRGWRELLAEHHARVRREFRRFGGHEVNTAGDGFLATFERPARAIRCAWSIREAVRELGLEVRSGIHAAEVEGAGGDLGGIGVHIGARIASQAEPGEILVSSTVRELVTGAGFRFEDRGTHRLKGVPEEWHLHALKGLPSGTTALRAGRWVPEISGRSLARRGLAAGIVAVAVLTAGWVLWRSQLQTPPGPALSRSVIAILPFSVQGGEGVAYLGEGMVNLLATKLDGAGRLRSVDSRALLSQVKRVADGPLDPEAGLAIASRFGAGLYVMGDIVEVGGRVRINAVLYDAAGNGARVGEGNVEGRADQIFDLVDELAARLLTSMSGDSASARVTRLAAVTTTSLPALKAYLEGDAALRAGEFEEAVDAFQRAVAQDTTFALGYYRLSIAAEWLTLGDLAHKAARDAVRHADRLTPRDRRLLEALLTFREGAFGRAEELYRSILGSHPDDVEALLELAEVLFHTNPFRARSFTEAREPFERVLSYEPNNAASLVHLARIAAFERRLGDLDAIVARYEELNPRGDRLLAMRSLRAFAGENGAVEDSVAAELDRAGGVSLALAIWDVSIYAGDLAGAERLSRLLAVPSRSRDERALGHAWLAHLALARGRWRAAQEELAAMEAIHPAAVEYRALFASLPFAPVDGATLEAVREDLRRLDPAVVPVSENPSVYFSAHDGLHPLLKGYLMGLLSARLGDRPQALEHAARVEATPGPAYGAGLPGDLALGIRAQLARAEGRGAEALSLIERTRLQPWYEMTIASPFHSEAFERFTRAELLREAGRDEEARAWYANLVSTSTYEIVYLPIAHLRQGQILERVGDGRGAAAHYRRFVELWRECDPELRPLRDEAEQSLARLDRGR